MHLGEVTNYMEETY